MDQRKSSAAVVRALHRRLQLSTLIERYSPQLLLAIFGLINGFVSIGVISATALLTRAPFVFPSAGATAFLLFFSPLAPAASPRNTILGHFAGAAAGYLALTVFGLGDAGPALPGDVTWPRVLAAGTSLGLAASGMVLLRAPHPPAGATALIVSLGLLPELWQVGVLMLAVVLLSAQAVVLNRLAGLPYPLWAAASDGMDGSGIPRRPAPASTAEGPAATEVRSTEEGLRVPADSPGDLPR